MYNLKSFKSSLKPVINTNVNTLHQSEKIADLIELVA